MNQTPFNPTTVQPGCKDWGYIEVLNTLASTINMPIMIINGNADGPTFAVTAGLYPTEYSGIESAARLYQQIEPSKLRGKLIIVPVVNMPVLQFRTPMFALTQSLTPADGMNINEAFPGSYDGSVSQIIARTLFDNVIIGSDYHVDLRGGDLTESHLQHSIYLQGVGKLDAIMHEMGVMFGLPYALPSRSDISHSKPGTLIYEAIARGIPSIMSQSGLGYNTQPAEWEVEGGVTGVFNLLKHFNMLEGSPKLPEQQHYLQPDRIRVRAQVAGVFKHIFDQGDFVKTGQRIGTIIDLDGTILSEVLAPRDAVVHEMLPKRIVSPGDLIYSLAVLDGPVSFPIS